MNEPRIKERIGGGGGLNRTCLPKRTPFILRTKDLASSSEAKLGIHSAESVADERPGERTKRASREDQAMLSDDEDVGQELGRDVSWQWPWGF